MKKEDYIPQIPVQKGIVFLKGSWYQMGKQYGSYAKDAVILKCFKGKADFIDKIQHEKCVKKNSDKILRLIKKRTPQIISLWKGIAKGAEQTFSDVTKAYVDFRTTDMHCSNISAWGKATVDNAVRCGMNCDEKDLINYYAPTVIAYPKNGFPFISASAITCNCVMNNQGLVLMASCGQNSLPEDVEAGLPNCISLILCATACKTAEEAKRKLINEKLGPGGGENIHIVDKYGTAFVIEHTAARQQIRVSGNYGEKDYLLATNHFITREMEQSNFYGKENQSWMNSYFRYWTLQHILCRDYGKISLDVLNQALGCKQFWGEDFAIFNVKEWTLPNEIQKGWNSIRDMKKFGKFSPEIQTQEQKCVFSALIYPEQKDFYILSGCRDKDISMNPWAMSAFMKIRLEDTIRKVVEKMQEEASRRIFEQAMEKENENIFQDIKRESKIAFAEGIYWKNRAICEKKEKKSLCWWNNSATAFLKAQQYSLMTLKVVYYDES